MIQSSNQPNPSNTEQPKAQPAGVGPQQTEAEKAKAAADKAKADSSKA